MEFSLFEPELSLFVKRGYLGHTDELCGSKVDNLVPAHVDGSKFIHPLSVDELCCFLQDKIEKAIDRAESSLKLRPGAQDNKAGVAARHAQKLRQSRLPARHSR
jgi:hypothetical protein